MLPLYPADPLAIVTELGVRIEVSAFTEDAAGTCRSIDDSYFIVDGVRPVDFYDGEDPSWVLRMNIKVRKAGLSIDVDDGLDVVR